jgi:hypothetical protein
MCFPGFVSSLCAFTCNLYRYDAAQIITSCETTAAFQHISEVAPFFEIDPHWNHNHRSSKQTSPTPTPTPTTTHDDGHSGGGNADGGGGGGGGGAGGSELAASVQAHHTRFGRRCFNTHLPWELMPRGGDGTSGGSQRPKYIYLVRDGRDAAVSFYHHLSNQAPADGVGRCTLESS